MLKAGLKNYFKNSWLIFIIAGLVYSVAAIIVTAIFFRFRVSLIDAEGQALTDFFGVIADAFGGLGPIDWLGGGVNQVILNLYRDGLDISFGNLMATLAAALLVILLTSFLAGLLAGFVIKRGFKNKDTLKWFLVIPLKLIISVLAAAVFALVAYYLVVAALIMVAVYLVFKSIQNIIEVKLIFFRKRKLSDFMTVGNIVSNMTVSILLLVISLIIPAVLWIAANFWIALIAAVPLFVYWQQVSGYTSVQFFMDKYKKSACGTKR